jgi:hypothetical protein
MALDLSRRQVLAGVGAAALVAGSDARAAPAVAEGAMVSGRVEALGRGLGGVMVSNGRDVVLSARDGRWSLAALDGHDIFVVKPAQYRVLASPGREGAFYVSCEAAATRGGEIVFSLQSEPEPDRFDVALVTDTQPDSHAELDFVRDDIFAGLLAHPAAFGIHHGDVVSDALDLYPRHKELLAATGMPWHHCVGNHDIDRDATAAAGTRATWRRTFGPRWYAFGYGRAMFLVLDNIAFAMGEGTYRGGFGADQLAFVAQVLAQVPADHLVVLSMHIPLRCYLAPNDPADTTADYKDLLRLLEGRRHSVSFAGHLHATEHHYLSLVSGTAVHHHHVLTAGSGSWWSGPRDARGVPSADSTDGSPNGFHMLRIDGNRYVTDFIPAAGKGAMPLRAMLQQRAPDAAGGRLLVNVFDGGPRTRVSFRIARGGWAEMAAETCCDPLVLQMLQGSSPRKPWVEATPSSHIWAARIERTTRRGPMLVEVRVVDEYGRAQETRVILEATAPVGKI